MKPKLSDKLLFKEVDSMKSWIDKIWLYFDMININLIKKSWKHIIILLNEYSSDKIELVDLC